MKLPIVIQGGMGAYVSGWRLAREVSMHKDCMGTISGIALDRVLAWYLQNGDPGGHFLRALSYFPFQDVAERVIDEWFVESGIDVHKNVPMPNLNPSTKWIDLTLCANFAVVWLAKEGHNYPVSINYLEKIQVPLPFSFVGAMLAGVDCITMGAGIPFQVPAILDAIVAGKPADYRITIEGGDSYPLIFDPTEYFGHSLAGLPRPEFLPIVSSDLLASMFARKFKEIGSILGFVVELPTAGGHNAPPRRYKDGEYIYGKKDEVNFAEIKELGYPFWIGGSQASPQALANALKLGAQGIQVGSPFALCDESKMGEKYKREIRRHGHLGQLKVITSDWSPTGYPFQVVVLDGTLSEEGVFLSRQRVCDKGYLKSYYYREDGSIGFRCLSEPIESYLDKGGIIQDKFDDRCLCNGLLTTGGLNPQKIEPPVLTLGKDHSFLQYLSDSEGKAYSAHDVIRYLFSQTNT